MNPEHIELKQKIEALEKVVQKNNDMLRTLYRAYQWGRIYKIVYWVLIIGLAAGAFYFIQPYVSALIGTYETLLGRESTLLERVESQLYPTEPADPAPEPATGGAAL